MSMLAVLEIAVPAKNVVLQEGVIMKISRVVILAGLALVCCLSSTVAKADAIDPKISEGGSGSCNLRMQTAVTQEFDNLSTGCTIDFQNAIGSPSDSEEDGGRSLFT